MNTFRELPLSEAEDDEEFLTATFTEGADGTEVPAGSVRCHDYLLEAHYKVIFDQNTDLQNSFFVKDLIVDLIYGSQIIAAGESTTLGLRTSVTYL